MCVCVWARHRPLLSKTRSRLHSLAVCLINLLVGTFGVCSSLSSSAGGFYLHLDETDSHCDSDVFEHFQNITQGFASASSL